ncbi:hypothetical protein Lal_00042255 [Lupinus albus]|nr:hypothetical protein Lal_00042255 [Lupinus albus]
MKTLWDEIENFMPIPDCHCGMACTCGIVELVRGYRERTYVIRFLKGLSDQYSHVRSQIMLIEPLHTITKAFSMVTQQETENGTSLTPQLDNDLKALNFQSQNTTEFRNNGNKFRGNNYGSKGKGTSMANQYKKAFSFSSLHFALLFGFFLFSCFLQESLYVVEDFEMVRERQPCINTISSGSTSIIC